MLFRNVLLNSTLDESVMETIRVMKKRKLGTSEDAVISFMKRQGQFSEDVQNELKNLLDSGKITI